MTPFEQARKAVAEGTLSTPSVSSVKGTIDYFWFQLVSHHFYMKIFAAGMTARGANLKTYKGYYGLKGRSAKDCLPQFEKIMNDYKAELDAKQQAAQN